MQCRNVIWQHLHFDGSESSRPTHCLSLALRFGSEIVGGDSAVVLANPGCGGIARALAAVLECPRSLGLSKIDVKCTLAYRTGLRRTVYPSAVLDPARRSQPKLLALH